MVRKTSAKSGVMMISSSAKSLSQRESRRWAQSNRGITSPKRRRSVAGVGRGSDSQDAAQMRKSAFAMVVFGDRIRRLFRVPRRSPPWARVRLREVADNILLTNPVVLPPPV